MRKHGIFLILTLIGIFHSWAAGPSGTLPVMYVNIENGQEVVEKELYLQADYWLDPMGTPGVEAFGSADAPLTTKIKGRGNYTFTGFDKKPYRLKLDKKQKLMGMKSSKHFGLLAHADDNRGFLRNALGFKVSELVGLPWTPEQYPIELVVNGTYRGLYFLTQLIRIDSDRVDITKWGEEDEAGNALDKWIEGGTIVEIDNYDAEAQIQFYNPGAMDILRFTYDKSVDPGYEPDGYVDWLKSSLGKVNDLILHGDRNSSELWDLVDIDDLARFIVVQEFTDNYESFHGSCYLYRDLGENEKWHFSPVWDFGSAFQRNHPDHPFYLQASGNDHYNHWVGELLEFPALREKIAEYWSVLNGKRDELNSYAEQFISQITAAAACDKQRWPQYGNDNLQGKLNEVKGYMNSAANYLSKTYGGGNVEDLDKDFYLVGKFNGWGLANPAYKFTKTVEGYTLKVNSDIEEGWKINDGTWGAEYDYGKGSSDLELNKVYTLAKVGGNIDTAIPAGSTLIFNPAALTLIVKTEGEGPIDPIGPIDPVNPTAPNFYLAGGFNGWTPGDNAYKFTVTENGYEFIVTSAISDEWKITNEGWKINYGPQSYGGQPIYNEIYYPEFDRMDNFTVALPAGSKIIFNYDATGNNTNFTIVTDVVIDPIDPIDPNDPDQPSQYAKTVRFVDAQPTPWEHVHVWIWNEHENFTGGQWPGHPMTRETASSVAQRREASHPTWTYTFDPKKEVSNLKMIFSNGQGKQTADLDFAENYTHGDINTGVSAVSSEGNLKISVVDGFVVVEATEAGQVIISDLSGKYTVYNVESGITIFNLAKGLHIINGHKIIL